MLRISTLLAIYVVVLPLPEWMTQLQYAWWGTPFSVRFAFTHTGISSVAGLIAAISLWVSSYFIFRCREWARRCALGGALLLALSNAVGWWGIWSSDSGSVVVQLRSCAGFMALVATPIFLALLLCSEAVVHVFDTPESHERI